VSSKPGSPPPALATIRVPGAYGWFPVEVRGGPEAGSVQVQRRALRTRTTARGSQRPCGVAGFVKPRVDALSSCFAMGDELARGVRM
jgi:hypothetical protein